MTYYGKYEPREPLCSRGRPCTEANFAHIDIQGECWVLTDTSGPVLSEHASVPPDA